MPEITVSNTRAPSLPRPPQRVVSLVPSLTESLFDLGFGGAVVGITDYCVHPAQSVQGLPRLGGTKNPRLADLLALQPDLVLANREENTRPAVEAIAAAGAPVWVSHPDSVAEALEVLYALAGLFNSQPARRQVEWLERSLDLARQAAEAGPQRAVFCPIWFARDGAGNPWWMTFNRYTYCHSLLGLFGGRNLFAGRERRYPLGADLGLEPAEDPGERDTRYPRLSRSEVLAAAPEVILLPSEPFPFDEDHQQEIAELLAGTPAVENGRLFPVDGSLITWHGTRLGKALQVLPGLLT